MSSEIQNEATKTAKNSETNKRIMNYKVPKEIWDRTLKELVGDESLEKRKRQKSVRPSVIEFRCKGSKLRDRPFSASFYLNMIKQSYEKRDWKNLYTVMLQGIKMKNKYLTNQILKYICSAIQHDPVATMNNSLETFLYSVKKLKKPEEQIEFIKNSYLLFQEDTADSADDDDQDDEE